jgi:hypothetical protein
MHIAASPAWQAWSELASRLPADLDLDALARSSKAIQRVRGDGIADGPSLFRLCLAHGPGGLSLQAAAAWAYLEGIAQLTAQSLNERLHRSVGFLAAILHRLLAAQAQSPPLFWPGRHLHIVDGSSLSQPGSKGTDWRLHVVYDLALGGFRHLEVTDRRGAESLLRCKPVEGEVLIADRGYAKARELRACLAQAGPHQRDIIVRVGWKALALRDPHGEPFSLSEQMQTMASDAGPQEWAVQAVVGSGKQPLLQPLRLLVMPLPPDRADTNRKKLRRKASKHQDKSDPRSLVAAGFMVLVTSLPQDIPAEEIFAAYRLRWQIELAIKWLKSVLHIDDLPTRTPHGSLCWLHAHLIMALLSEDIRGDFLESSP